MRRFFFFAVVVAGSFVAGIAVAGPSPTAQADITQALQKAQVALSARSWPDVVKALEGALVFARHEAPLVISAAEVVDAPHTGLGVYRPLKDGAVAIDSAGGAKLMLYVEVENLEARPVLGQPGKQQLSLEVSGTFSAIDAKGALDRIGTKNLGTQTVETFRTTGVHSFGLDVSMGKDAPGGRFVVELEVRDTIGGKSARRSVPFVLLPP